MLRLSVFALAASAVGALCACEDVAETPCSANDECASGQSCVDGGSAGAEGEGEGAEGEGEGEGEEGEGEGEGEGEEGEGEVEGCRDDGDASLSPRELPLAFDIPLRNIEAVSADEDLAVDVVGVDVDGVLHWDFSAALPDDAPVQVVAEPIDESRHWFDDEIESPELEAGDVVYASLLDAATWGVFERTADGLFILAVASDVSDDDEPFGYTFISYDPPILAMKYPLTDGESFDSVSQGSGTFEGSFYSSTDTYESTVAGRGIVTTPAGDFPVWRVQTRQEVAINFTVFSVEHRQVLFVTACTGVVASVTSAADAPDFEFTEAQRVRRVGLSE